jgi:molybdopterin adenylyltransferase
MNEELVIGLVSISDRASTGVYEDKGIPALQEWLSSALTTPWRAETRLIADDRRPSSAPSSNWSTVAAATWC